MAIDCRPEDGVLPKRVVLLGNKHRQGEKILDTPQLTVYRKVRDMFVLGTWHLAPGTWGKSSSMERGNERRNQSGRQGSSIGSTDTYCVPDWP